MTAGDIQRGLQRWVALGPVTLLVKSALASDPLLSGIWGQWRPKCCYLVALSPV